MEAEIIEPYQGNDMVSYIMEKGFKFNLEPYEYIQSITNIQDTAIIVTNYKIWRVKPCYQVGFCIECLVHI